MNQSYHSQIGPKTFLRKLLVNWRYIAIALIEGL